MAHVIATMIFISMTVFKRGLEQFSVTCYTSLFLQCFQWFWRFAGVSVVLHF
jgi:hypothetical protein